jgi:putative amino-acid transport system substrate-binding protein
MTKKIKLIKAILAVVIIVAALLYGVIMQASAGQDVEASNGERVITIGGAPTAYPMLYMEGAEVKGSFVDFANAIGEEAGYTIDWEIGEWSGILASLQAGRIDSAANFAVTPERAEMYDFTDTILYSGVGIGVAEGNTDIQTFDDLKGKSVNSILGSNYGNVVKEMDPNDEITIEPIEDINIAFNNVYQGKVDAVTYSYESLGSLNKNRDAKLVILDEVYGVNEVAFPFAKMPENEQLIVDWNQAIETLRNDGTLAEISEKWYGMDVTESPEASANTQS